MCQQGMDIRFRRTGGFAGLSRSARVNTARLPREDADEFERLVSSSDFFQLPSRAPSEPRGPDRFQYAITVSKGGEKHTVSLGEGDVPDRLKPLLHRLDEVATYGSPAAARPPKS